MSDKQSKSQIKRLNIQDDIVDGSKSFVCPKCYGHHWGTSMAFEVNATGHCHDEYGVSCRFSWPRDEDEKYFK